MHPCSLTRDMQSVEMKNTILLSVMAMIRLDVLGIWCGVQGPVTQSVVSIIKPLVEVHISKKI